MQQVIDRFGLVPSSPGDGTPFTLFACHDTEGGTGRTGAAGTIQFLHDTAAERNASYHEIWGWDAAGGGVLTVFRIVPANRAAHSVAPQPPPGPYEPDAWVRSKLGVNVNDPNQGVYAISIAGKVADVDALAVNPAFLREARIRFAQLSNELGIEFRAEHFRFNPRTRTDWGRTMMAALGGLTIPEDHDMTLPPDVPSDHWAAAAIRYVIAAGIMTVDDDGNFEPSKPVSRAVLAATIRRLLRFVNEGVNTKISRHNDADDAHS